MAEQTTATIEFSYDPNDVRDPEHAAELAVLSCRGRESFVITVRHRGEIVVIDADDNDERRR